MASYNLTEHHKQLLRQLVRATEEDKLPRTFFVSVGQGIGWSISEWEGDDRPALEFLDIEDLARDDFLSLRVTNYSRTGNPIAVECALRQKAFDAVSADFAPPEPAGPSQVNIGAIVHTMGGGSLQAVGVADAEVSQIVNDPALLHTQVEALTENLLNEVKPALSGSDLMEYVQAVQELQEQLLAEQPDPSLLKRLTGTLAFLGDVDGTIGLMVRTWPFLYPLLLIAAERLR